MSAPVAVRRVAATRDDWETPPELFHPVDAEFRFTLDAAASAENRKCTRFLTAQDDALSMEVRDEVIWCNPPYGRGLDLWCDAFARWALNGCTVVALLPNSTDTRWFANVWTWADEIRILSGRVNFVGSRGGNTVGNILAVYRPRVDLFDRMPKDGLVQIHAPRVVLWEWRG